MNDKIDIIHAKIMLHQGNERTEILNLLHELSPYVEFAEKILQAKNKLVNTKE